MLQGQNLKNNVKDGNTLYNQGKYDEAEVKYRQAMAEENNKSDSRWEFNLGDALYKQERYEEAAEQFAKVANQTENEALKAQALHNLGNALVKQEKLKEAVAAYKNSLRLNPNDEETRANLTNSLRKMQQQQKQEQKEKENDLKPSEYAKQLKAKCDALVRNHRFAQAFGLMQAGLKKDETVAYYQSFIKKLQDVVEIESQ